MLNEGIDKRKYYLDIIRIIATFAVITLHVSSTYMDKIDTESFNYMKLNAWNTICHWAVGMFVMISGALFLDSRKETDIARLYKHNICRIIYCFIFWSLFYTLLTVFTNGKNDTFSSFLAEFIKGHYHMWFLYMIVGVYMMIPIIKLVTKDWKVTKYFCVFIVVFGFVYPSVVSAIESFKYLGIISEEIELCKSVKIGMDRLWLNMPTGYLGYFVLGYVWSKATLKKYQKRLLYLSGLLSFVLMEAMPFICKTLFGKSLTITGDFSVANLLFISALFVWMKENIKVTNVLIKRIISYLSGISFGVYLIHALVIEVLDHPIGFNAMTFDPGIGVLIVSLVVAVISILGISIMKKIPFVKKFC